jgi:hypothetical protein
MVWAHIFTTNTHIPFTSRRSFFVFVGSQEEVVRATLRGGLRHLTEWKSKENSSEEFPLSSQRGLGLWRGCSDL